MAAANQEVKKTLTVVDRSTKALSAAADGIVKAAADLQGIAATATALAQDIEFKQNELDNLDEQLVVKQRLQAAELSLKVKEDADAVLATLLKERGLVSKTPAEIKEVDRQLAEALEDNQDAVDAAVAAATSTVESTYKARLVTLDSEHKVAIAQLNANASADKRTIESQAEQIAQLRDDLAEERKARVQTEEARARAQGVVVNTNGK